MHFTEMDWRARTKPHLKAGMVPRENLGERIEILSLASKGKLIKHLKTSNSLLSAGTEELWWENLCKANYEKCDEVMELAWLWMWAPISFEVS